jgi:hypothetical protein
VAQQVRRCGRAAKVYIFNQQIGSDDSFFAGGVLRKTAASSPMPATSDWSGRSGALPQRIDEIEFAF